MEEVSLILTALAAGATGGALDAQKDDVKDKAKAVYVRLQDLVRRRFQGNASAEVILSEHQADPQTYASPLAKKLTEAGRAVTPNSWRRRGRSWDSRIRQARGRASTT
jgi:hypothetical protein